MIIIKFLLLFFLVSCSRSSGSGKHSDYQPIDPNALQGFLQSHNAIRSQKGVAQVTWSVELEKVADSWAGKLAGEGCGGLRHSGSNYGENLSWNGGNARKAEEIVIDWASEEQNYNYSANSCNGVCGHYTQVVWRKTKEIGCAVRTCKGGSTQQVWVCNYNPAGNYLNQRPY
jgi:pathogenesis-related protein 1